MDGARKLSEKTEDEEEEEEVVVVVEAGKSPTHEAFLAHKKTLHIKEELWFMKRCRAVVPRTEDEEFCLSVRELKQAVENTRAAQERFTHESDQSPARRLTG
ncbi:unnamed protein product [Pleuronectes platessa]|uniref:Uncharacterized protein n=1 Tax=Pleuronectes platessa TaxID=8262 RepID=A0A9N7YA97_PLEPL|nr:unnamed protein product [Pleuronectes platessa]